MSQQQTKNSITLKGSAQIICEYLRFAINSVLFQRGLYPPESFKAEQEYGLTLLISEDPLIKGFISDILRKSEEWILKKEVKKLSLVIINVSNKEVLECWDFNVQYEEGDVVLSKEKNEKVSSKDLKKIQLEIRDVMLQVAATISYLPLLDCRCSFDIYVHANPECNIPEKWMEAAPISITNAQNVQLKSFSTNLHKMDTVVTYKLMD
ncbi:Mitotic spindle assembly checkpoint protein MAD2A [Papilio machaon]|uniref:Mitotic spindle assembly checkpoint protein MAD2A n=1 Tax=Papilio machaon TaxID=76193 RepID=A0A194RBD4_PAPMA|nr:mitotic spindle assembly checkpoint protein MAD2A [Papilio machaon]KPJ14927.1 Mitotic spindle assembly checkpoint protein MAD2A [Papilio machaon]